MEYLVALLKSNVSEGSTLRLTMMNAMIDYAEKRTLLHFLSFDNLKSLLNTSLGEFRNRVLVLMMQLANDRWTFFQYSSDILPVLVESAKFPSTWDEIIQVASTSLTNPKVSLIPCLLVLIWCGSICMIHLDLHTLPKTRSLTILESLLQTSIQLCDNWIQTIFSDAECLKIVRNWSPMIICYQDVFTLEVTPVTRVLEPIPFLALPEVFEPLWLGREKVIPELPVLQDRAILHGLEFLSQLVKTLLTDFGFSLPFPVIVRDASCPLNSYVVKFIANFFLNSPSALFGDLLHDFFFGIKDKVDLLQVLAHLVLSGISTRQNSCDITLVLDCLSPLIDSGGSSSLLLVPDLLHLASNARHKKLLPCSPGWIIAYLCHERYA
jgi:hypothetical protein